MLRRHTSSTSPIGDLDHTQNPNQQQHLSSSLASTPATTIVSVCESNSGSDVNKSNIELIKEEAVFCGPPDMHPYLLLTWDSIVPVVWKRTSVLVSLLLIQSLSQLILERYEDLIKKNVIIPLFLTMLVGAGGNAGNQATVRVITGLATGSIQPRHFIHVLRKEMVVGLLCALLLCGMGYARVHYFYGREHLYWSVLAITLSLFCIVLTSVILGCILPFVLLLCRMNVEHAAPMIQVLMDIIGVMLTCVICSTMIPPYEGGVSA
eukprot:PhM_4_TR12427/c0_g1_i1/m.86847